MECAMAHTTVPQACVRLLTRLSAFLLVPLALAAATTAPAHAGLEVCNQTNVARWVAVGYSKDDMWTSEGWWNVEPGDCAHVLDGDLTQQYYYYRAEDPNEEFEGDGYFFCSVDDAFTIVGDQDCAGRGYEEVDFRELDTGESTTTFTLVLNPTTVPGAQPIGTPAPEPATTGGGLEVCNQTNVVRWVAIGYNKDDMWTSEGWWELEPDTCAQVLEGELTQRYYYYRAEDPNENFKGDGYMFCAVDDAFTIVGDQDCVGRGYKELAFREVDTGPDATTFTLVLNPTTVPGAAPIGAPSSPAGSPPPPPVDERAAEAPTTPPAVATTPGGTSPFGAPPASAASTLSEVHQALTGRWRSVDDPAATVLFEDGLYTSFHAGTRMESGGYEVSETCPAKAVDAGGETVIVVRLPGESQPQCFGVLYIDAESLELINLPRGNLLRYKTDID
jgi:uncharacterized membrane protein